MNIREWTLPIYTILLQLSLGAVLALWIIRTHGRSKFETKGLDRIIRVPLLLIFFTILTAMVGSHLHLSQPALSILAVLNFHTSWLSREIAFNILYFFSTAALLDLVWYSSGGERLKNLLAWITILLGCLTIYSMGRVYLLSTQPVWNTSITIISFFSTTILLGVTALPLMMILDFKFAEVRSSEDLPIRNQILRMWLVRFTLVAIGSAGVITACNLYNIVRLRAGAEAAQTSLQLLFGLYEPLLGLRILATLAGLGLLIGTITRMLRKNSPINELMGSVYLSCMLVIVSEILGRILFYATHVRLGI